MGNRLSGTLGTTRPAAPLKGITWVELYLWALPVRCVHKGDVQCPFAQNQLGAQAGISARSGLTAQPNCFGSSAHFHRFQKPTTRFNGLYGQRDICVCTPRPKVTEVDPASFIGMKPRQSTAMPVWYVRSCGCHAIDPRCNLKPT